MLPTWPLWVCCITCKMHKLSWKDAAHDHQKCSQASPIFCSSVCIQYNHYTEVEEQPLFRFHVLCWMQTGNEATWSFRIYLQTPLNLQFQLYYHKIGYRYLFSKLTSSPLARFSPIFIVHDSIIPTLYGKFANFELWTSNKSVFHHGTCQKSI